MVFAVEVSLTFDTGKGGREPKVQTSLVAVNMYNIKRLLCSAGREQHPQDYWTHGQESCLKTLSEQKEGH